MDVGLLSAFLGGTLALLSPCAALLVPAFFASTVGAGPRLLLHGAVYYVGLLTVLVPLGAGVGALGSALVSNRQTLIAVASIVMILLGLAQIFGYGFDPARLVPGGRGLETRASAATGYVKTFLLGAASGVAGFCAGPILGAVLTLAAGLGDARMASLLLAAYGAGMVAPLLLIAACWQRLGARGRALLRGRAVSLWGREFHTTSLVTGTLIVVVGILFWRTNGFLSVGEFLPEGTQNWLGKRIAELANPTLDVIAIVVVAVLVLVVLVGRRRAAQSAPGDAPDGRASGTSPSDS